MVSLLDVFSQDDVVQIRNKLLLWFKKNRRTFPWRETRDPYKILIAEKLLQQTSVREDLVRAYETITERYPSPVALATSKLKDLKRIFKPLGLQYRAKELKKMGLEIVEQYNSSVPERVHELMSLTGIGDYSARAVASFSRNEDFPVVDTNVARFIYRLLDLEHPMPKNPARSKTLLRIAGELLPQGKSRDFNFAVLDLCAKFCKAKNPDCTLCPLKLLCFTGRKRIKIDGVGKQWN